MANPSDIVQGTGDTEVNVINWNIFVDDINELRNKVASVVDYGATGNGSTDDRSAINDAHAAATANGGAIYFGGGSNSTYKLSSSITFNSNVTLIFAPGAKLSIDNTFTISINGEVMDTHHQIFSGAGLIDFSSSAIGSIRPEWWGAVADDDSGEAAGVDSAAAINAAIASAGSNSPAEVRLRTGIYHIGTRIQCLNQTILRGTSSRTTIISGRATFTGNSLIQNFNGTGDPATHASNGFYIYVSDIYLVSHGTQTNMNLLWLVNVGEGSEIARINFGVNGSSEGFMRVDAVEQQPQSFTMREFATFGAGTCGAEGFRFSMTNSRVFGMNLTDGAACTGNPLWVNGAGYNALDKIFIEDTPGGNVASVYIQPSNGGVIVLRDSTIAMANDPANSLAIEINLDSSLGGHCSYELSNINIPDACDIYVRHKFYNGQITDYNQAAIGGISFNIIHFTEYNKQFKGQIADAAAVLAENTLSVGKITTDSIIGPLSIEGETTVVTASSGASAAADADDLVVENSVDGGITILVPNAAVAALYFGVVSDSVGALLKYDYTGNVMTLSTANVGDSLILGSGNVVTGIIIESDGDIILPNGVIRLVEITTPTALNDYGTFYTQADNFAYFQSGDNNEHIIVTRDAEIVTTGSPTLQSAGSTALDSSSGAITATLGSGQYIGQIKTIVMIDATTSSTVSITNHQTSDPEIATFDAIDEVGVFLWGGTEWITLLATCTFI